MSRTYGEPVNVQARDDGRPARFVWQGRLYTVRAIEEHWLINREWWQDPAPAPAPSRSRPQPWSGSGSEPEPAPEPEPGPRSGPEPGQPDLEFWRVQASSGPGITPVAYELRREAATDVWTLRVY